MCPNWAEWFAQKIAEKGRPKYHIPAGKMCGSCRRMCEHEVACKDPWDIVEPETLGQPDPV